MVIWMLGLLATFCLYLRKLHKKFQQNLEINCVNVNVCIKMYIFAYISMYTFDRYTALYTSECIITT